MPSSRLPLAPVNRRACFSGFIAMMVLLIGSAAGTAGQQLPGQDEAALRVYSVARQAGEIAGYATYCKAEADTLESYIIRVEARIGLEARDEFDRISARVLFRNIKDAKSGAEPTSGCPTFLKRFERAVKEEMARTKS